MRVRVLRAKLYAYALPGSTARDSYSTARHCSTARQLDSYSTDKRHRQTSTDLDRPRRPGTCSQARRARQLLDSYLTGSTGKALTAPRQYGSQPVLNRCFWTGTGTSCFEGLGLTLQPIPIRIPIRPLRTTARTGRSVGNERSSRRMSEGKSMSDVCHRCHSPFSL